MSENKIINWENVFAQSENFQNQKPFRFGFIEEFINHDFYEKLYETFPKIDDMILSSHSSKTQFNQYWGDIGPNDIVGEDDDPKYSDVWNNFKRYVQSEEFLANFKKFSGIPVNRLRRFTFTCYKQGGFQYPHIHNVGPSTLIMMVYFSKGWNEGEPGGTYMATDLDEQSIIFEPYNLDNSLAIFHDGPKAAHGVRLITKSIERRALQITLECYDENTGWSGGNPADLLQEDESAKIEL